MSGDEGLEAPVHEDFRGTIRRHEFQGEKFNVLFTKEGAMRSGDYHPHKQFNLILEGKFEITLRKDGEDVVMVKGPNELIEIPPEVPHLFKALEDTVMLEWWDGPLEVNYYEPYRKLIEEQFDKYGEDE